MNPEHISKPQLFKLDGSMYLDSGTIRKLDIVSNLHPAALKVL